MFFPAKRGTSAAARTQASESQSVTDTVTRVTTTMPDARRQRSIRRKLHAARQAGKITVPECCENCGNPITSVSKYTCAYIKDWDHPFETVVWCCLRCYRELMGQPWMPQNGAELRRGHDGKGKLPDYATLKRLILQQGLTYREVSERYDTNRYVVARTFKARAQRRGEWEKVTAQISQDAERRRNRGYSAAYELTYWKSLLNEVQQILWDHEISQRWFAEAFMDDEKLSYQIQILLNGSRDRKQITQKSYRRMQKAVERANAYFEGIRYDEKLAAIIAFTGLMSRSSAYRGPLTIEKFVSPVPGLGYTPVMMLRDGRRRTLPPELLELIYRRMETWAWAHPITCAEDEYQPYPLQ